MKYIKYRKGVTLIEALFVLGIMAIILGGVMLLLSQNTERLKFNQFRDEIMLIGESASTLYQSEPEFDSQLTPGVLIKSGLIPQKYIKNNDLVTPWGTTITWNSSSDHLQLMINLPTDACKYIEYAWTKSDQIPNIYTYQCIMTFIEMDYEKS